MVKIEIVCEGMCDAEMVVLKGPRCIAQASSPVQVYMESHGFRTRVWTLMLTMEATTEVDEEWIL